MSFWDTVGKAAKAGAEHVKDYSDDFRMYKERFEGESDDELHRIYDKSSGAKKSAASAILRERGHNL